MGYIKVWIHFVWITKHREPILTKDIRKILFSHIRENAEKKDVYIDFINGYLEHVHCLISLNSRQTIEKVIQSIKGESSRWINLNKLMSKKFKWQHEYFAVSVSESGVNKVREYIKNQESHHQKKSFDKEYYEFIEKYGFTKLID
jgi:putative transposase